MILETSWPEEKHVLTNCLFHRFRATSNLQHSSTKQIPTIWIACAQAQVSLFRRCSHWSLRGVCAVKARHKGSLYPGFMASDQWNSGIPEENESSKTSHACDAHQIIASSSQSLWGSPGYQGRYTEDWFMLQKEVVHQASELPRHPQNVHRFRFYTLVVGVCTRVLYHISHMCHKTDNCMPVYRQ